jgi:hypothetical protein
MSTFNEQLQLSEYIVWRFKKNGDGDICMAAAGFVCLVSQILKKKRPTWVRLTLSKRKVGQYDSDELLIDLRNVDIRLSGEIRSSIKKSCRISSEDFGNLEYFFVKEIYF